MVRVGLLVRLRAKAGRLGGTKAVSSGKISSVNPSLLRAAGVTVSGVESALAEIRPTALAC